MCSVTIFKGESGEVIITMNRDENLQRVEELSPQIWKNILAPIDPESGGTWVGVNEKSRWSCLLNGYEKSSAKEPVFSRGKIIERLLEGQDIKDLPLNNINSFRLLFGGLDSFFEYYWNGKNLKATKHNLDDCKFFTSSSLLQEEVKKYRQNNFKNWAEQGAEIAENGIPKINLYQDPDNKEYGILMQRDYTKTKSITQIVLHENSPNTMNYWGVDRLGLAPISKSSLK